MKRVKLITAILILILLLQGWGLWHLHQYAEQLSGELQSIATNASLPQLEELTRSWEKERQILGLYLHEAPLDLVEENLYAAMDAMAMEESPAPMLYEAIRAAKDLWRREIPTLDNIF